MENKWGRVCSSLPPGVKGHLRGYIVLNAPRLHLNGHAHMLDGKEVTIQIKWWGEVGKGITLSPQIRVNDQIIKEASKTTACYAIRCNSSHIYSYLTDMNHLTIDVVKDSTSFATCILENLQSVIENEQLSAMVPVISHDGAQIGQLNISLLVDSDNHNEQNTKNVWPGNIAVNDSRSAHDLVAEAMEKGYKLKQKLIKAMIDEQDVIDDDFSYLDNGAQQLYLDKIGVLEDKDLQFDDSNSTSLFSVQSDMSLIDQLFYSQHSTENINNEEIIHSEPECKQSAEIVHEQPANQDDQLQMLLYISNGRQFTPKQGLIRLSVRFLSCAIIKSSAPVPINSLFPINFLSVQPMLTNDKFVSRLKNNFVFVELWHSEYHSVDDQLIGLCKLPLDAFYGSLEERQVSKSTLQHSIAAVNGWMNVINPITDQCNGQIHVLLALATDQQAQHLIKSIGKPRIADVFLPSAQPYSLYKMRICIKQVVGWKVNTEDCEQYYVTYAFPQQSPTNLSNLISGEVNKYNTSPVAYSSSANQLNHTQEHELHLPLYFPLHSYLSSGLSIPDDGVTFYLHQISKNHPVAKAVIPLSELAELAYDIEQKFTLPLTLCHSYADLVSQSSIEIAVCVNKTNVQPCDNQSQTEIASTVSGGDMVKVRITVDDVRLLTAPQSDTCLYVSYNTASHNTVYSPFIHTSDNNATFDWASVAQLSNFSQNLIVKLWTKSSAVHVVDKLLDQVYGFVCVPLYPLLYGMSKFTTSYNIIDFCGQNKGQMNVCVEPLSQIPEKLVNDSVDIPIPVSMQGVDELPTKLLPLSLEINEEDESHKEQSADPQNVSHVYVDMLPTRQKLDQIEISDEEMKNSMCDRSQQSDSVMWQCDFVPELPHNSSQSFLVSNLKKNLNELEIMQEKLLNQYNNSSTLKTVEDTDAASLESQNISPINIAAEVLLNPTTLNNRSTIETISNTSSNSKPYLISSHRCENVTNNVNITVHHSPNVTAHKKLIIDNCDDEVVNSDNGTYVIDNNDQIDSSANHVSEPDLIFEPLENLEECVKQLSLVLSNVCNDSQFVNDAS